MRIIRANKAAGNLFQIPPTELIGKHCYEIFRNGKTIGKVAKGTYSFDHSAGADLAAVYEVRTVDGAGNVSAFTSAKAAAAKAAAVLDDAPNAGVVYAGEWKHDVGFQPAHEGTISVSDTKGAAFELAFDGRRILWFSKLGDNCGKAAVSIDGGEPAVVDTYSADDIWGVCVFRKEWPAGGKHTIRIEVLGDKGPRSKGNVVHVDGLRVESE